MERTPKKRHHIAGATAEVAPEVERLFAAGALTPRRRRMVEAYVREGTYAAAARASGYAGSTVKQYVLHDPHVRKAIGDLVDQAAMVTGITLERVLHEYGRLAFSDIGEVVGLLQSQDDPDIALAVLAGLPADVTAAISKIEIARKSDGEGGASTGTLKVHFWDKRGALNDIARMLALFKDTVVIEDTSTYGERLGRAISKLEAIAADSAAEQLSELVATVPPSEAT